MTLEDALQIRHYRRQPTRGVEFLKRFYHDELKEFYDDVDKFIEEQLEPEECEYYFIEDSDCKTIVEHAFDLFYYQRRIDKKKKLEFGDNDVREWLQIIRKYPDNLQEVLVDVIRCINCRAESYHYTPAFLDMIHSEVFETVCEEYARFLDG